MAENSQQHGGVNSWFSKFGVALITMLVGGLIAWGTTLAKVDNHDKRIEQLEQDRRSAGAETIKVSERLARIEAQLQFIVEQIRQREGR